MIVVAVLVAYGLLLTQAVTSGLRPGSLEEVAEFADLSGIETTPSSRIFVGYYLVTSRRLRTILVMAAVLLPGLLSAALGPLAGRTLPDSWQLVLGACLAGTVWAELTLTRPTGTVRLASLRPRHIGSYLDRSLVWSPAIAGLVAAVLWAGAALDTVGADRGQVVGGLVLAVALPAVVAAVQRWIVARPQPYAMPSLVDADDAIRAASVRYLGAVGSVVALVNVAGAALQYSYAFDGPADVLAVGTILVALGLALVFWVGRMPGHWVPDKLPRRAAAVAG